MKFTTIDDAAWAKALKRARGYTNSISTQLMRLHPTNPTPGIERKDMITYTKNEPVGQPAYYAVMTPNKAMLGTLEQEVDGFYYFYPHVHGGFWSSAFLHDIARKLDALNEAWNNRINEEMAKMESMNLAQKPKCLAKRTTNHE